MVKGITYQNVFSQEENTPIVAITTVDIDKKQATATDTRKVNYVVDLAKAAFGGVTSYPQPGSTWYLKKISNVWTLMARGPRQNPQLDPALTPVAGDTYIGSEGTTHIMGSGVAVDGSVTADAFHAVGPLASSEGHTGKVVGDANKRIIIKDDGTMEWGPGSGATDTTLYRASASVLQTEDTISIKRASSTDVATTSFVTGDSVNRLSVDAAGIFTWGSGSATRDTTLYRGAADTLETTDEFRSIRAASTDTGRSFRVTGDSVDRLRILSSGKMEWGSGSGATDTNLYRSAADTLKTDDTFNAVTDSQVNGTTLPRGIVAYATRGTNGTAAVFGSSWQGVLRLDSMSMLVGRSYRIQTNVFRIASTSVNDCSTQSGIFLSTSGNATTGSTLVVTQHVQSARQFGQTDHLLSYLYQPGSNVTVSILLANIVPATAMGTQILAAGVQMWAEDVGPAPTDTGVDI